MPRPAHRATRTPDGLPRTGGPQPSVRYDVNPPWPGITSGHDARCWACSWAWHQGVYQIKIASPACGVAEHRTVSR